MESESRIHAEGFRERGLHSFRVGWRGRFKDQREGQVYRDRYKEGVGAKAGQREKAGS